MATASEVARYLVETLPMDTLKLQKLLYYSQAVHLVRHDKECLFPDPIEAWAYGPVVPSVYQEYRSNIFDAIPSPEIKAALTSTEQNSVTIAIGLYGDMSGPELINQTHYESPWKNAYSPERPSRIISVDSIYEYYKDILVFPEMKSSANTPSRETIKAMFFENLKESVDLLIPQDEDVIYSENPLVDIEAIAKKVGITNIQRVPQEAVFNKHALLIETNIYLKQEDSPEKQHFSIAHEIFHFLTRWLRSDVLQAVARQGETWKRNNTGSIEAVEEEISDYFAANLLIPTERFILWEDKPDDEIARAFGVEPRCIKKRREEIEMEIDLMTPKDLASGVKIEETTPLTSDELNRILGGSDTNAKERV
jgi:uncharacterized phage-associated protein/Zn-dependent peptidase ImmA (M78 family)